MATHTTDAPRAGTRQPLPEGAYAPEAPRHNLPPLEYRDIPEPLLWVIAAVFGVLSVLLVISQV